MKTTLTGMITTRQKTEKPSKRGHIVAATLVSDELPVCGKTRQHCCAPRRHEKCFWSFCVQATKFVSATNVERVARRVNIWELWSRQQCCRHNVYSFWLNLGTWQIVGTQERKQQSRCWEAGERDKFTVVAASFSETPIGQGGLGSGHFVLLHQLVKSSKEPGRNGLRIGPQFVQTRTWF